MANKYPQHAKLDKVKDESQTLGFFVEWLQSRYSFCKWHDGDETFSMEGYYPESININRLLAEYYKIDYDKLMLEKDKMLIEIRSKL